MAATKYSQGVVVGVRRDGVIPRREYLERPDDFAKRGQGLPHSKLLDIDVISIRSAVRQRESLLKHIRDNLSNRALMSAYGVSEHTITRVVQYQNYGHLA
jgi:hypothetical protein